MTQDLPAKSRTRPSTLERSLLVALVTALVLAGLLMPASAGAFWRSLRLIGAGELGYVSFDDLASFVAFRPTGPGQLDEPLPIRFGLADENAVGFRVGLELDPQIEILWSRLQVNTRMRVFANGEELQSDPGTIPPIVLPDVDVRIDMISLSYRFRTLEFWNMAPVTRLGFGWILTSQKEDLRLPGRLPANYSDSDKGWELSAGLVWRWRIFQAGGELRSFHWRWDAEDGFIPARTTNAWMLSGWLGLRI